MSPKTLTGLELDLDDGPARESELFLVDDRPRGVAVAWDTRPTHRHAVAEAADVVYKEGRRPMPDLLAEQFPHFRPIVEAFGYRNLEFEGWEADDVIATLAARADEAGLK